MHVRTLLSSITLGLAITTASAFATTTDAAPKVDSLNTSHKADTSKNPYHAASGSPTHAPQPDGRHEIRFTLLGCPAPVRPKISGTSGSQGHYTPSPPGSIIVPADFIGSVYLTGEGCGKYGDHCQSVDLTFEPNANRTVRSYINLDAMYGKKFLFPVRARFDDGKESGEDGVIECESYDSVDGSRDPDDFISNRVYSSTRGVGVDIVYDCRANTTSTAD
ncbi:conserved hypothetical protein [Sporisorium reilianum SRZ2]|uniref:Uncharacterized protein n=1 Tax=Sporisorium reilianum (strain SRZ2) TaxID=999809 RepID=E6ZXT8_SPORE|nr:conserved hypothetical protein [Sporisorium reilianum SRZ2]